MFDRWIRKVLLYNNVLESVFGSSVQDTSLVKSWIRESMFAMTKHVTILFASSPSSSLPLPCTFSPPLYFIPVRHIAIYIMCVYPNCIAHTINRSQNWYHSAVFFLIVIVRYGRTLYDILFYKQLYIIMFFLN